MEAKSQHLLKPRQQPTIGLLTSKLVKQTLNSNGKIEKKYDIAKT